jgi:ABC-type lipoprotein release transport system permease subunit
VRLQPATLWILVVSAARNVVGHRIKSLVVGFILMFGAALLVIGTSLLSSVQRSMERTVTASLAGHLQVYSADTEDDLALFGGGAFEGDDIGEIDEFSRIRTPLEAVDNVRAVVPMGLLTARVLTDTPLDEALGELRAAVTAEDWEAVDLLRDQIGFMLRQLRTETENRAEVDQNPASYEPVLEAIDRALSDDFWEEELRDHPRRALQFLDTEIAPQSTASRTIVLRMLGIDPPRFAQHFDRFKIVDGQPIPEGRRGMLISNFIYENRLKNPVAQKFDTIEETLADEETTIAESSVARSNVRQAVDAYQTLLFGLAPGQIEKLEARIREFLGGGPDELKPLVQQFLRVDDSNFQARYEFFYNEIAPLIELYEFEVGDTITLQSFGQSGFTRSANVKIWGVYAFEGLEDLELAGSVTLLDMVTFRQLYGVMTEADREELEAIQENVDLEDVDRDGAEEQLFGGGADGDSGDDGPATPERNDDGNRRADDAFEDIEAELEGPAGATGLANKFEPAQIDRGLARNAAVILEDPERLDQTREAIQRVVDERDLGLEVVDWQTASGLVGQFITVIRLVLYVSIGIVFLVALVIINNSMVMATVERTGEIGTLRAMGAPRWYVSGLFVLETAILGLAAGIVGCALGALAILVAGQVGIPATTDVLEFLFSGAYLYPSVSWWNIGLALALIIGVSALSTLYPARLATRIQPVVAMRRE